MIFLKFENFLNNSIFTLLFLLMIFQWIYIIIFPNKNIKLFTNLGILVTNFFLIGLLLLRWLNSGHFPLSNLYESLIFLSWTFVIFYIFLNYFFSNNFEIFGALLFPIILFIYSFANFSIPQELQNATPLIPALQSNWLMMHVTIMMLSYCSLLIGCLLSISFLVLNFKNIKIFKKEKSYNFKNLQFINNFNYLNELIDIDSNLFLENKFIKILDNLSYRLLTIGFFFLTLGIISGSIWANEAWGSYWSWDPKETWAFITWLIFAVYLHSRIIKGWSGIKPAIIATLGFFIVWICYLGVNLLGKGLHSYGWFNT
uniref:Cytochrome c biogenesis protein CcsA n=1 Tax=Gloeotilopsis sterilis TaxID=160069 RepID=A0A097KNI7_GLOST|nr:heme attachment to plastid cytochrome c [Gloeotilopsis sterilis]AIT94743.1 heme attachment to plastid cytochrome c [Gloeotilopsis sterilis]